MEILGIDIGGSGIKGAPVDTEKGVMLTDRHRISTPDGGKPDDVAEVVGQIVKVMPTDYKRVLIEQQAQTAVIS